MVRTPKLTMCSIMMAVLPVIETMEDHNFQLLILWRGPDGRYLTG
jgi:hypothetical protein